MSKNIAISDEVYERLKREKGDRSFSEVIAAKLEAEGRLMEVTGTNLFEPDTFDEVKREIGRLSERTVERVEPPDEGL